MCLLVVVSRPGTSLPLLVAANRDERMDRPAVAVDVLRDAGPRILGGRDLLAGGTWLAVNEHGVVAGLTNTPSPGGRDPTKRSRGELPLLAAAQPSAELAVRALRAVSPQDYNPAWMLVGDRRSLYSVTLAGDRPAVRQAGPGVQVLENRPLTPHSAKVRHVRDLLDRHGATAVDRSPAETVARLAAVLGDHSLPDAACVHTPGYGTRSSAIVMVGSAEAARPTVLVADGAPCEVAFADRTGLWWGGGTGDDPAPAGARPGGRSSSRLVTQGEPDGFA